MPAWTPTTLSTHLMGELNQDRNAAGGTVPARLMNLVKEAYEQLWEMRDWNFRTISNSAVLDANINVSVPDTAATLGDTSAPTWDPKFNRGWHLLAQENAERAFGYPERADATQKRFETWLAAAIEEDERDYLLSDLTANGAALNTVNGITRQLVIELHRNTKADAVKQMDRRVLRAAVANIVLECGKGLWHYRDWRFRRKVATLSITAATSAVALPADFAEFDGRWLEENTSHNKLRLHEDAGTYQGFASKYESTATGEPTDGIALQDGTQSTFVWKLSFCPTADATYTYTYHYLISEPFTTGGTTAPKWPVAFNEGWLEYARAKCRETFEKNVSWTQAGARFKDWLTRALAENNETVADGREYIEDGYADLDKTASSNWGEWLA